MNENKRHLTDDEVRLIRECWDERQRLLEQARALSQQALAEKFDVHPLTIRSVVQFRTYREVG